MDEDEGWVTPKNYENKMNEGTSFHEKKLKNEFSEEEEVCLIALMTADYAMQNVATQIGMNLLSLDGRKINEIRRFIWECYTCWKQYK